MAQWCVGECKGLEQAHFSFRKTRRTEKKETFSFLNPEGDELLSLKEWGLN